MSNLLYNANFKCIPKLVFKIVYNNIYNFSKHIFLLAYYLN